MTARDLLLDLDAPTYSQTVFPSSIRFLQASSATQAIVWGDQRFAKTFKLDRGAHPNISRDSTSSLTDSTCIELTQRSSSFSLVTSNDMLEKALGEF